jgi:predicted lipid-binding transport protein (Tim44 family)
MEEDEREGQENQPEPEIQPGPEDEGKEELPESESQPVAPGVAEQEQSVPGIQPQVAPTSSPGQPPSASRERRGQFLLGLGIGFIPLVLFFIGFVPNASALIIISLVLLLAVLIASIICIAIPRVRYIGYGLLTSIPISLVVGSIGCIIIISRPPSG